MRDAVTSSNCCRCRCRCSQMKIDNLPPLTQLKYGWSKTGEADRTRGVCVCVSHADDNGMWIHHARQFEVTLTV